MSSREVIMNQRRVNAFVESLQDWQKDCLLRQLMMEMLSLDEIGFDGSEPFWTSCGDRVMDMFK